MDVTGVSQLLDHGRRAEQDKISLSVLVAWRENVLVTGLDEAADIGDVGVAVNPRLRARNANSGGRVALCLIVSHHS
jgi:hypothetical protein